jgi:hypothetical protein
VLFGRRFWDGIADGSITLAYRRWKRTAARAGARHRVARGVIEIVSVTVVEEADIRDDDARRAGYATRAELLAELARHEGALHRVEFRYVGADPRIALRKRDRLDSSEMMEVAGRLHRLDRASRSGPWTRATLELIGRRPGVAAGELAPDLGRERAPFKRDVRKLKELGLTESLPVGYRLSPRGHAVVRWTQREDVPQNG